MRAEVARIAGWNRGLLLAEVAGWKCGRERQAGEAGWDIAVAGWDIAAAG